MTNTLSNSAQKIYWEWTLQIPRSAEEQWSQFCFAKGCSGVQTLKDSAQWLEIIVYFNEGQLDLADRLFAQFKQENPRLAEDILALSWQDKPYQDWQSNWQEYFEPIEIGEHLLISPPWKSSESHPSRKMVVIHAGQGFGTGYHASTQLALVSLEKVLCGQYPMPSRMLDIGAGSGILSIAAHRLGVNSCLGIDLDEQALENMQDNIVLNDCVQTVQAQVIMSSVLHEQFPLIISNMLFHELLSVVIDLQRLSLPQGLIICSGLLEDQLSKFQAHFPSAEYALMSTLAEQEWRCLILQKLV